MDYLAIQILAFVKANPGWAMLVIGLTAFVESFVFLSLLFPGTAILIAAGTLVSEGILSPVPTVVAGIAGAVLGEPVLSLAVGPANVHCILNSDIASERACISRAQKVMPPSCYWNGLQGRLRKRGYIFRHYFGEK